MNNRSNSNTHPMPPALVMNLFYSGLGIARDLRRNGVRVIGLSADPAIYGNFTRSCEVCSAPNSQNEQEQLLEYLLSRSRDWKGAVVFPTRDWDVLFLDHYRVELGEYYKLAIPPRDSLKIAMDKHLFSEVAQKAGIAVPHWSIIRNTSDLADVSGQVGFPCVLKPISSVHWRGAGAWQQIGGRKALLVSNASELCREYQKIARVHSEVLAQQWIPGSTDQLVIIGGFIGKDSQPLAYFTGRKVLQSPDDFGTGCIVNSELVPEIVQPTLRLWKELKYQGMAEVEYKRDPGSGEYKLIEMNVRHWDQHQLAAASDINLSWLAYCHLTGIPLELHKCITAKATWIAEDAVLHHLLRALYRREVKLLPLLRQIHPRRIYAISSIRDPWPSLRYFPQTVFPELIRILFRSLHRKIPD